MSIYPARQIYPDPLLYPSPLLYPGMGLGPPQPTVLVDTPTAPVLPDLLDDLPPFERSSRVMQGVLTAIGNELGRLEAARQDLITNWFPGTADALLHFYEQLLGLPTDPPNISLDQRRKTVMAFMQSIKAQGTGLAWEQIMSSLIGNNWSYEEHDPNNSNSPPPYTILIRLPFAQAAKVPTGLVVTPEPGSGTLPAGTYYYAVAASTTYGETLPSSVASGALGAVGSELVAWTPNAPKPTPTPIRSTSFNPGSAGGTSPTMDTTGASLLVVTAGVGSVPTITDSLGNDWTVLQTTNGSWLAYAWKRGNGSLATGAAHTITVAGANSFPSVWFAAYSGTLTSSDPLEQSSAPATIVGTSGQPGQITPMADGELIITVFCFDATYGAGNEPTIDSGFNVAYWEDYWGGTAYGQATATLVQAAAAAVNPTWTHVSSGGNNMGLLIASFKADTPSDPTTAYNVYRGDSPTSLGLIGSTSSASFTDDGSATPGRPPSMVDASAAPQSAQALTLARAVTPAHIAIDVGYTAGFLVGVSEIGIDAL